MSVASKTPQVQNALVGFMSETAIDYRGSSIVVDCGGEGSLRAGDRMPDLDLAATGNGRRNLLAPLQHASHLAIALDVPNEDELRRRIPRAEFLSIHTEQLTESARENLHRTLGRRDRIIIVRPDGYIGLRASSRDAAKLDEYARHMALQNPS